MSFPLMANGTERTLCDDVAESITFTAGGVTYSLLTWVDGYQVLGCESADPDELSEGLIYEVSNFSRFIEE